jgi:hypothetical protein
VEAEYAVRIDVGVGAGREVELPISGWRLELIAFDVG